MKKLLLLGSALFMFSCANQAVVYKYTGAIKTITGDGGFYDKTVFAKDVGLSSSYKHEKVSFYLSGLPYGQDCAFVGFIQDTDTNKIIKKTLEFGGNVVTHSMVSFPTQFHNNKGFLDVSMTGGNTILSKKEILHQYNMFDCVDQSELH